MILILSAKSLHCFLALLLFTERRRITTRLLLMFLSQNDLTMAPFWILLQAGRSSDTNKSVIEPFISPPSLIRKDQWKI